jgi:tRNA threonylcarbamoyladenosine dehydratase
MSEARFSRLERMIGPQGLERLHRCRVTVVGLGAVGSYAVEGLARAGIGMLRLVDFDEVRPSNINRQLYALTSTLGRPKVLVAKERVLDIYPDCRVETLEAFAHRETMDQVLEGPPDVVLDAIDALTPKVELLIAARGRGIPVVSCMGAALRTDPGLVRVGLLSEVHHCPLSSRVRRRLKRRGVPLDFACVYSVEPVKLLPTSASGTDDAQEELTMERGRKRGTLGSLPTLTGIFGLTLANAAIRTLLGGDFFALTSGPAVH